MTSASTTLYDVTDDVSDYVDDFDVISINDVDVAFASQSHIVFDGDCSSGFAIVVSFKFFRIDPSSVALVLVLKNYFIPSLQ